MALALLKPEAWAQSTPAAGVQGRGSCNGDRGDRAKIASDAARGTPVKSRRRQLHLGSERTETSSQSSLQSARFAGRVSNRKTRVLIADDEPHVLQLLSDFLSGQGYDVTVVANGAAALSAVPTVQPDVILLDMVMPGLTGRDVFDALRGARVTVPVILMSGNKVALREGFFAVLAKPFDLGKLGEVVAAAVDLGQTPNV